MPAEADLLAEGLALADAVCRRLARRLGGRVNLDDLRGIARLALIDIIRTFDPVRATFAPYATLKLKWAVLDELRRGTHGRTAAARFTAIVASERLADTMELDVDELDEPPTLDGWQSRLSSMLDGHAAALAIGLAIGRGNVMEVADTADTPEDQTCHAQLTEQLRDAVTTLPDRQRELIQRHYYGGEQFDAIAHDLGVSKSWASRLHERAIVQLGEALRDDEYEDEQAP